MARWKDMRDAQHMLEEVEERKMGKWLPPNGGGYTGAPRKCEHFENGRRIPCPPQCPVQGWTPGQVTADKIGNIIGIIIVVWVVLGGLILGTWKVVELLW